MLEVVDRNCFANIYVISPVIGTINWDLQA